MKSTWLNIKREDFKMKVNEEIWKEFLNGVVAVNCRTEDEANQFLQYCHGQELKWFGGNRSLLAMNNFNDYCERTCYELTEYGMKYGRVVYFEGENYRVYTLDELFESESVVNEELWSEFIKDRLYVNCQSEDESNSFLEYCHSKGLEWSSGTPLLEKNYYVDYENEICYFYQQGVKNSSLRRSSSLNAKERSSFQDLFNRSSIVKGCPILNIDVSIFDRFLKTESLESFFKGETKIRCFSKQEIFKLMRILSLNDELKPALDFNAVGERLNHQTYITVRFNKNRGDFTFDRSAYGDFIAFADLLKLKYPENNHIKDKIRQQLQVLRDRGIIEFVQRGHYRKVY